MGSMAQMVVGTARAMATGMARRCMAFTLGIVKDERPIRTRDNRVNPSQSSLVPEELHRQPHASVERCEADEDTAEHVGEGRLPVAAVEESVHLPLQGRERRE